MVPAGAVFVSRRVRGEVRARSKRVVQAGGLDPLDLAGPAMDHPGGESVPIGQLSPQTEPPGPALSLSPSTTSERTGTMFAVHEPDFAIIVLTAEDMEKWASVPTHDDLSGYDADTLALATLRACLMQKLSTNTAGLLQAWGVDEDGNPTTDQPKKLRKPTKPTKLAPDARNIVPDHAHLAPGLGLRQRVEEAFHRADGAATGDTESTAAPDADAATDADADELS